MPKSIAKGTWKGNLPQGSGTLSVGTGTFEAPFNFDSRFGDGSQTNPEELIGAALAGCYSMALSHALATADHTAESVETEATVTLEKLDDGPRIQKIELVCHAQVTGIDEAAFRKHATETKDGCPVSKALQGTEITLQANLRS